MALSLNKGRELHVLDRQGAVVRRGALPVAVTAAAFLPDDRGLILGLSDGRALIYPR